MYLKKFGTLKCLVSLCLWASIWQSTQGQCSGGTNGGALSPAPSGTFQTMGVTDGNYYTFTVGAVTGCSFPTYTFTFCSNGGGASYDTQITILDNAGIAQAYNDDFCALQSHLTFTPTSAGTYRVLINQYNCSSGGGTATLAYQVNSPSGTSGLFSLVGDAVQGSTSECVQLTSNVNNQTGCAWDLVNPLDFSGAFSVDYTINLGNNDGGADGMAFVIQNDPSGLCACGSAGGSLGATGISNSLIIEIDTYLNSEDRDDGLPSALCFGGPEPDHLDIWLDGNINPAGISCPGSPGARIVPQAVELQNGGSLYNIENGLDHVFRIQWTPGSPGILSAAILDLSASTTYGSISYSFDPLAVFGTNMPFSGFSAATGGLNNVHAFCAPTPVLDRSEILLFAEQQGAAIHLRSQLAEPGQLDFVQIERQSGNGEWERLADVREENKGWMSVLDRRASKGWNAYRAVWKDQTGQSHFSEVQHVNFSTQQLYTLYPSPATDYLEIRKLSEEALAFELIDATGKQVLYQASIPNIFRTNISSFARGLYIARFQSYHNSYTEFILIH